MKHTPGPWNTGDSEFPSIGTVFDAEGEQICQTSERKEYAGNRAYQNIARCVNAEFISATPDLYEVCKTIEAQPDKALEIMKHEGFVIDNLEDRWQKLAFTFYAMLVENATQAKEAIAKAEGTNDRT